MFRMYENEMDDYNEPNEVNNKATNNNNNVTALHKTAEQEKKRLERKIIELTRNNSKLSSEVEVLRKKSNTLQDKYKSICTLFDKDKFIGLPTR